MALPKRSVIWSLIAADELVTIRKTVVRI